MLQIRTRPAGAAVLAAAVAIATLLSTGPAMADKLVIFKNGKALMVKSVEQDGQWLRFSFGGDDSMAVPISSISEVTEAELPASARAGAPNQVVEGEARNYSNRGSVQDDNRGARALNRGNDQDREQPEVEADAGAGAIRRGPARSTARTTRTTQQNNPLIQGLTPLNTSPNQAARSGLLQRRGRFTGRDQAAQPEQEQPKEEDN